MMQGQPQQYQQPMPGQNNQMQMNAPMQMQAMQARLNQLEEQTRPKPFSELIMKTNSCFIKQKFELFEAFTGCETENKYEVFPIAADAGKRKKWPSLVCKQKSSWFNRNCLRADCRPFNMECYDQAGDEETLIMLMERPCQCTFYCINRPKLNVNLMQDGAPVFIGKIVDNCDLCNFSFSIFDANDTIVYFVKASCCQLGFHCKKCPFDACERIVFEVYKGNKEVLLDEKLVKTGQGCVKNMLGDADNFTVPLPTGAPYEHRCLLIATALMIDYLMFETSAPSKPVG